jgi:hypothetical protein
VDFDSAIPRFESWRPSQPVRSLRCDFQVWENRRHSRGLAGNGRVFGEENWVLPTEGVHDMAIVPSVVPPAANDGGAQQVARGGPAPSSAGLNTEVAKPSTAFDVQIGQAAAKTGAKHPEKSYGIGSLDQNKGQSIEVQFSSPEKSNGVLKSSSSNFAIPGRPRIAVKLQITSRTLFKQASLENRNTSGCSGYHSCPGDLSPLFGVGF